MSENVIRSDVIQIAFDTNLKVLTEITNQLDDIKKSVNGTGESDGLDKVKKQANGANESAKKLTKTLGKVGGALGTVAKKAAGLTFKGTVAGIGLSAAAIGGLTAKAVSAYGEFEQLKGGVDTLFKDSSKTVQKYANDAYKTAGLSANAYMETATSFSASLIQSLKGDTAKAAVLTDKAITDMADNANKMGTDIGSLQYAYQGFAKQNYTMLDNLKLGYGGTKEEMKRLLKDAGKLANKKFDLSSYADVIEAIHVIQDNMGITGTTAKEANFTIQGSISSMKSAWGNLMPALIKGGDEFDQCVDNLIESIVGVKNESGELEGGVINNLLPAVEKSLGGIGTLIEKVAPIIEAQLPGLIDTILPPLIRAATSLFVGLAKSLPTIVEVVIQELPVIAKMLYDGLTEAFGKNSIVTKVFDGLISGFNWMKENMETVKKVALGTAGAIGGIFIAVKGFKAVKSISSLFSAFGGSGDEKGGKGKRRGKGPFEKLAKMKPKVVLKGMANLAIIIGGFTLIAAALMLIAPYMSKLSDTKSILKVVAVIGIVGVLGTALALLAQKVGNIPVATVAKGLANMAIMLGGLGAVAAAFLWLSPYIAALGDTKSLLKVVAVMTILGVVGGVLSVFAGIVGIVPMPLVLSGLANIALVLGGMAAVVSAFGLLTEIPGFTKFVGKGGELLVQLCDILGQMVGALLGGAVEQLSSSLPALGDNLGKFGTNIKPLFTAMNGVDIAGAGAFFGSLVGLLGVAAGNEIVEGIKSFFGGESEGALPKLGKQLSDFATNSKPFFTTVSGLPENGFTNATKMFDCLAGVKNLPKEGGVAGWFGGEIDYSKVAKGLGQLAAEGVKNFFSMVGGLDPKGFDNAELFFKCLGNISKLPKEGGWWDKLTGTETTTLGNIAKELGSFGDKTGAFFEQVNGLDVKKLNALWDSLADAGELTGLQLTSVLDDSIKELVSKVTKLPKQMADGINSTGDSLAKAIVSIWENAVRASIAPVNKLISGANWVMKQFGSNKTVASWTPYARGTGGHKGGNAMVNDGRGAELVQMPNGHTFIPRGRNVLLPNAPKGMKVLDAERTARLFGKGSPTFRYANGTGFDVFEHENGKSLANAIAKHFVNYDGMSGYALNVGKAVVATVKGEMSGWGDKLIDEFGVKGLGDYVASAGVAQWKSTVIRALRMEGLYSAANVKRTLYQMQTESGGNPRAINLWDSNAKKGIPSKGLMQVIDPTFRAYARAGYNRNIYDPLSNILASVRYATSRYGSLAKAYQGHGYSDGVGTISLPQYSPASSVRATNRTEAEYNSYAPVFNLTINGADDEKAMYRKVKRWVTECMEECFEGMARRN